MINNMGDGYDVAQICLNGHIITDLAKRYPVHQKKHCPRCGEPTIMQCPNCNTNIQGQYYVGGYINGGYKPYLPAFCHECGISFPWTIKKIKAAQDFIQEDDDLSETDKKIATDSIPDMITENPNTQVAALKVKKTLSKVGLSVADGVKSILVDVLSETAKKILWGV